MNWQESEFQERAEAFLEMLFEQLEEQDSDGALDIDLQEGILMLEARNKEFIVSKHSPSQQIWLSSPLSGGLHFDPADAGRDWKLKDGRRLSVILSEELSMVTGTEFAIEV